MQAPGRSVGLYLPLEKISTALSRGRERASLTVSIHIAHSDTEQSVLVHSNEWASPERLNFLFVADARHRADIWGELCIYQKTNVKL